MVDLSDFDVPVFRHLILVSAYKEGVFHVEESNSHYDSRNSHCVLNTWRWIP